MMGSHLKYICDIFKWLLYNGVPFESILINDYVSDAVDIEVMMINANHVRVFWYTYNDEWVEVIDGKATKIELVD